MKDLALKFMGAAVLAAVAPLAAATATSSAGLGAITITLIDLDPNDGITPSILFAADPGGMSGGTVSGETRSWTADEEAFREFRRTGATQTGLVGAAGSTPMASASGSINGIAGAGFSAITTQGSAGSGVDARGSYGVTATSPWALFTLSANTAVQFSVAGWARGETSTGGDPSTGWDEAGGSLVYLTAGGIGANGEMVWDDEEHFATASYVLDDAGNVHGTTAAWDGILNVTYSNLTGADAEGRFAAETRAFGHSAVSAVPEPATGAMLLAGLGLVGCVARRRRA